MKGGEEVDVGGEENGGGWTIDEAARRMNDDDGSGSGSREGRSTAASKPAVEEDVEGGDVGDGRRWSGNWAAMVDGGRVAERRRDSAIRGFGLLISSMIVKHFHRQCDRSHVANDILLNFPTVL